MKITELRGDIMRGYAAPARRVGAISSSRMSGRTIWAGIDKEEVFVKCKLILCGA